jgi:hypothetical protein
LTHFSGSPLSPRHPWHPHFLHLPVPVTFISLISGLPLLWHPILTAAESLIKPRRRRTAPGEQQSIKRHDADLQSTARKRQA